MRQQVTGGLVVSLGKSHRLIAAAVAVAALAVGAKWAGATTISLAGGTTSDGLNLTTLNVVDAVYAQSPTVTPTSVTFQGVTFVPVFNPGSTYNTSIAISGVGTSGTTSTSSLLYLSANGSASSNITGSFTDSSSPSANASLVSLLDAGLIYNGSPYGETLTATISNLSPNTTYRLDFISSLGGYGARNNDLYINGVQDTTASDDPITYAADPAYDTSVSAMSNGSGVITASIGLISAGDPFYNAIVVSAPTPEPTGAALVGLPALAMLVRRRRRSGTPGGRVH